MECVKPLLLEGKAQTAQTLAADAKGFCHLAYCAAFAQCCEHTIAPQCLFIAAKTG
jgi:hypothetical protein